MDSFWQIFYIVTAFWTLLYEMHSVDKSPQSSYLLMIWYLLMSLNLTFVYYKSLWDIENWKYINLNYVRIYK